MRDIPVLKLCAFVVLASLAVGGWRSWHASHDGRPLAGDMSGVTSIELLTTADKASWIRAQVYGFNYAHQDKYQIIARYVDSRAAMQKLIAGADKPVLWSPESPIWVSRANDLWRAKTKQPLVAMDDFSKFRVFLRTPLVFLTTTDRVKSLRAQLGGENPWTAVHDSKDGLRFSIADPLRSNSGAAGLSMMLTEYASARPGSASLREVADTPGFAEFVATIGRGAVVDSKAVDAADITAAFAADPKSRDFVVTYENLAFEAARRNPRLAVIYPSPSMVAQQSLAIVDAPWVSDSQRAGAGEFMAYLSRPESIRSGLKYSMRGAVAGSGEELDRRFNGLGKQGFQSTFATEEAAPYLAVNAAAAQWHKHVGL